MRRLSKCGAENCDCDNHCGLIECHCSHTSCRYGWVDIGPTTRPCGNCRPQMYENWIKSIDQQVTYSKYVQRTRGGRSH